MANAAQPPCRAGSAGWQQATVASLGAPVALRPSAYRYCVRRIPASYLLRFLLPIYCVCVMLDLGVGGIVSPVMVGGSSLCHPFLADDAMWYNIVRSTISKMGICLRAATVLYDKKAVYFLENELLRRCPTSAPPVTDIQYST